MGNEICLEIEEQVKHSVDFRCQPYLNLWFAVLNLGVIEASGQVTIRNGKVVSKIEIVDIKPVEHRRAVRWLLSDTRRVGSFIWICELFEFDPNLVRFRVCEL